MIFARFAAASRPAQSVPGALNPTVWFDASDLATITQAGGAVSQWDDKSGNNYDASQATAAYQPQTGTRTINGLNVIDFDGSNDALDTSFVMGEFSTSKDFTMFAVVESDTTATASQGIAAFTRSGSTYDFSSGFVLERRTTYIGNALGIGSGTGSSGEYLAKRVSNSSLDPMLITFDTSASGGTSNVWIDGVSQTMSTYDGTMAITSFLSTSSGDHQMRIGGRAGFTFTTSTGPFDGAIAEIIVYDYVLSASERGDVETYLTTKWAI